MAKKLSTLKKSELIDEYKALLKQKEEAEFRLDERKVTIDDLTEKVKILEDSISSLESEKDSLNEKLDARIEENHGLSKELQAARTRANSLCNDCNGMQESLENMRKTNSKLIAYKYVAIVAIIAFLFTLCIIFA